MKAKRSVGNIFEEIPDIECVVIFTDGMHSVRNPSHFEYFSDVSPVADRNCILATRSGERSILINLPRDVERVQRHSGITDVQGTVTFDRTFASLASEMFSGPVGVAGVERMTPSVRSAIDSSVSTWRPIDDELIALTSEKSDEEIQTFRELGRIADEGFQAVYDTIRPGITEYELAAEVEYAMRTAGAEDNFNLFGSGVHNQLMHSPTDRIVRSGDTILCELSPMMDGYVLQICRTISLSSPSTELVQKFALLREAMEQTLSEIGPGTLASTIYTTMNKVFEREGYADYCRPPYMRTRGHEFGFGEIGMAITESTDIPLSPGMVLVVHPNQYIPETGYLALGDPILINEDGIETLTRTPARLFTREVCR